MSQIEDQEHYQLFTKAMESSIAKYGYLDEEEIRTLQRDRVNSLSALEVKFRKELIKDKNGDNAYNFFVSYILDEKKNTLVSRPYFREKKTVFAEKIFKAIKERDIKALQKEHVNYHFIALVTKKMEFGDKVMNLANQIMALRQDLVVMNLPLVINRARIFWSRTPKSHLSFMDLIQIGVEGLLSGVDKYCGEYSGVWCGVAIGRMVGDFIESYSATLLHFYPSDKRKIYRANKFMSRHMHGDYEIEDLAKEVGKAFNDKVSKEDILGLMAASSVFSTDSSPANESDDAHVSGFVAKYAAPDSNRPDLQVEANEAQGLVNDAIKDLSLFDKKLLRLKGIDIDLIA